MRIFSIHKSKSKKQISEKTPKLAAQKFLEKRKVGTVIYLHEHPSGKIHGPYRKEYDKNIMKGGRGDLERNDFKISENLPLLEGTNQLIIKEKKKTFLKRFIVSEPYIFFGDNTKTDDKGNHYFTYVCKNKDYDINNLISFRKLEDSVNGAPPQIRELTLEKVKQIPPETLLAFYIQYIDRCKDDFSSGRPIVFRLMYMRRLFFYLFYHILPVIGGYILGKYFQNINQNINQNRIQELINNPEIRYFMNIVSFIKSIPVDRIIDEICFTCNISITDERIIKIKEELIQSMEKLKNSNILHQQRAQELRRSISGLQEINHNNIFAGLAHGMAMTGTLPNPVEVVQTTGLILGGIIKFCEVIGAIMGAFR